MKNIVQRARKRIIHNYDELDTKLLGLPAVTKLLNETSEWDLSDVDLNLLLGKSNAVTYDTTVFNETFNKTIVIE